jgi:hypothetical protein
MKSFGIVIAYLFAGVFFLASLFEMGHQALVPHSFDGFKSATAFLIAYFTAGGNMIANDGYQSYANAWAETKVK